jgi:hypothetical protein
MSTNSPSYYAVIPAEVRYCKNLEPSSKLLYGEITALCNKEGYCWASNRYFSELYDVDDRTVKRWIKSLEDENFIKIETERKGFSLKRKIYINQIMFTKGQKCPPEGTKMSPRGDKNVTHNNTSNNTSKNKESEATLPRTHFGSHVLLFKEEYDKLAIEFGKDKLDNMIEEINLGIDSRGYKYKDTGFSATIRRWFKLEKEKSHTVFNKKDNPNSNADWVREKFSDGKIYNNLRCDIDLTGVSFVNGSFYKGFKYDEFNFKDNIENFFRKRM